MTTCGAAVSVSPLFFFLPRVEFVVVLVALCVLPCSPALSSPPLPILASRLPHEHLPNDIRAPYGSQSQIIRRRRRRKEKSCSLRMAYLLAGITTPGNEANPRRLEELHFVGSTCQDKVSDCGKSSMTPGTEPGRGMETRRTCCFLGPFPEVDCGHGNGGQNRSWSRFPKIISSLWAVKIRVGNTRALVEAG